MKDVKACEHIEGSEGRKKSNAVDESRCKLEESILSIDVADPFHIFF